MKIHTAVKGKGDVAHSTKARDNQVYYNDRIVLLQHDICLPDIPDDFYSADVIHSIIAWKAGYDRFTENTIAEDSTFDQYLSGIKNVCETLNVPAFILCGKSFVNKLSPHRQHPVRYEFHNCDAVYAVWNYSGDLPYSVNAMQSFVGQFGTVLDFCCGFGSIAYYVPKCVLSDINTECIEYVRGLFACNKTRKKG